ncbi:unnamed protein product [Echinostoma caproni]|uniref:DUF4614 domain-containing protein n=1 Tax=Echinostoma caproni TaxID=27848 RepID=A0A183B2T6_9TREM|nr:unnamed protein product [Echinostoma caproni]
MMLMSSCLLHFLLKFYSSTDSLGSKPRSASGPLNTSITSEESVPMPNTNDSHILDPTSTKLNRDSDEVVELVVHTNKPRRSNRSLRTRHSRTPSEVSYSEGEVLSDSDEDRDGASSVGEANEVVPELLGEKTNVEGQDEERAAEIIQLVHNQFRDATPVSDIDLTELEIMDEWATPAAAAAAAAAAANSKRTDTEPEETAAEQNGSMANTITDSGELTKLNETNQRLSELISEAVVTCGHDMDRLVLEANQSKIALTSSAEAKQSSTLTPQIHLSEDVEASIERTASAFKEHVTSVLANLLHAVPTGSESGGVKTNVKRPVPRPVVCGRRGSRLLGMLQAYRPDAAKRLSNSNIV